MNRRIRELSDENAQLRGQVEQLQAALLVYERAAQAYLQRRANCQKAKSL